MEPRPNRDALNVVQFNLDIIVDPSVVSFPMNTTNDDDFARNIQQFQGVLPDHNCLLSVPNCENIYAIATNQLPACLHKSARRSCAGTNLELSASGCSLGATTYVVCTVSSGT